MTFHNCLASSFRRAYYVLTGGSSKHMPSGKITKRQVDQIKPGKKEIYLWDLDLAGFGLKTTPTGRKTYLVQYRLGGRGSRTRRMTIGQHGILTADQARLRAKKLLGEVAVGNDPAAIKDQAKAVRSLGEVLEEFFDEHVETKLKKSTALEYRRILRLSIPKELKRRAVTEITRVDIARLHHKMRDKPYQANRTIALLSKFFNWCEKHGIWPDGVNPCRHIDKYPEKKHERFLSSQELASLSKALTQAEVQKTATPWMIAAIRLLLFTGARLGEVLNLRWENIDFEIQQIRLPDSKTGKKSIYLNAPALLILSELPQLKENPFVICGEKPGSHLVNLQRPWRRIRDTAGLSDVRIHDLRHTFASIGAIGGVSLPILGGLVGHTQPQTTARYAHLSADPLRAANDAIGERISQAMTSNTNVVLVNK